MIPPLCVLIHAVMLTVGGWSLTALNPATVEEQRLKKSNMFGFDLCFFIYFFKKANKEGVK